MSAVAVQHSPCCDKPNINRMVQTPLNAICLRCRTHWWGDAVYTSNEWDALLESWEASQ